ncbi:MAG: hypothetical protein IPH53_10645 [Flavobacteriales bacterium]|nr:hypothetical protein [Flavobacteriales bacterium]
MKGNPQLIDTRSATVELVSPELIEVRFKPEVKLDVQGLGEIVHAKNHLGQGLNPDVLAVAPPELDFELNVLHMDHAVGHGVKCNSNRLAFAALKAEGRDRCVPAGKGRPCLARGQGEGAAPFVISRAVPGFRTERV